MFNTNIKYNPSKIFALSDIHGDIDALIIALRDCAQVIQKKPDFEFNQKVRDPDLSRLLSIDICDSDNGYIDDLNYMWVGSDAHVVIIGDLIDGVRVSLENHKYEHEYPQVEIKIIRFLNALDIYAEQEGGRIIKLIGNHEASNFTSKSFAARYAFPSDIAKPNYYRGQTRQEIFLFNNIGFNLFRERGTGILLKLSNNIFVHGQLVGMGYKYYEELNEWINSPNLDLRSKTAEKFINLNLGDIYSSLWARQYGDVKYIDERFESNQYFCDVVKQNINSFCHDLDNCMVDKMRVIVGHCPQNSQNGSETDKLEDLAKLKNRTHEIIEDFGHIQVLRGPIYSGPMDPTNSIVFGISMECDQTESQNYQNHLYRVDIGASRAFDKLSHMEDIYKHVGDASNLEKLYLLARTPQVLKLTRHETEIIRSGIANTRIHQPRQLYEELTRARETKELVLIGGAEKYMGKYLKYKYKLEKIKL